MFYCSMRIECLLPLLHRVILNTMEMRKNNMNPGKKIRNATMISAFILTLFLAGCGDSEMAKGITDAVKKSVEGELTKKGEEIKKQIDQVINLGTGKGQKEDGQGAAGAGKEKAEKGANEDSAAEND
jgi:hypothetical protein